MENEPEFDQENILIARIDHTGQLECPRCRSTVLDGNPAYPRTEVVGYTERTSPVGTHGPWQRLHFRCGGCCLYFALFIGTGTDGFFFHVIPVAGQGFGKDPVFHPEALHTLGENDHD